MIGTKEMILSPTDEYLVNEVAKALLLHGIYHICQGRRLKATATTTLADSDSNATDDWTEYVQHNIPYHNSSSAHRMIMKEITRRRLSNFESTDSNESDVTAAFRQISDPQILTLAYSRIVHPWNTDPGRYHRYLALFQTVAATTITTIDNNNNGKTATSTNIGSISLFSSVSSTSTSILNTFVTFDIIKEKTQNNLSDMVPMLKDVTYLEDLIPDIDDICLFLRNELFVLIVEASGTDTRTTNSYDLGRDIIDLHRHWFHRTRTVVVQALSQQQSDRMFQTKLIYNFIQIVEMVDSQEQEQQPLPSSYSGTSDMIGSHSINTEFYRSCIVTALDMFTDWMDRSIYTHSDPMMNDVGLSIWNWSMDMGNQTRHRYLRGHCPTGRWLCQYVTDRYMTINDTIDLLSQFPRQQQQQQQQQQSSSELVVSDDTASHNFLSQNTLMDLYQVANHCWKNFSSFSATTTDESVICYDFGTYIWILSFFRSILVTTHVSYFPWNLLSTDNCQNDHKDMDEATGSRYARDQSMEQIYQLYLQLLQILVDDTMSPGCRLNEVMSSLSLDVAVIGSICIDSIETFIVGTSRRNEPNCPLHCRIIQDMQSIMTRFECEGSNSDTNTCSRSGRIPTMIQQMTLRLQLSGIVI